jgi:hypothetical protein
LERLLENAAAGSFGRREKFKYAIIVGVVKL